MSSSSNSRNPRKNANGFSRFFHCWLSSLIAKSRKQRTLHLDDLCDIPNHLESTQLADRLETNWLDEIKRCPNNPSLIRATFRTMGWKLLLCGLLLIPVESLNIMQPFLLTYLMKFFEPCPKISTWQVGLAASAAIMALLCINLLSHQYIYRIVTYGTQMRVAYAGLVFRKVLRLSSHAMNSLSSGEITNLLANDVHKVELVHYFLNYLWVAPLQITVVIFLLWHFIRYITCVAIGYTLLLLLMQPVFSRLFLRLRTDVLKVTDERIKIMSELLKSMRIVKMYNWENAFEKKVRHIRKREITKMTSYMMCTSMETILSHTYLSMIFLLMYGVMWLLNMKFDTSFFTLSFILLNYTRQSCVNYFNFAIRDILNYMAAQRRIRTFLLNEESERNHRLLSKSLDKIDNEAIQRTPQMICYLKEAQWQKNEKFSLKNIIFEAGEGDLICIIGPVGCGKSSLLQTLAGEITHFDGKVRLNGSLCYVPQEPWIFSSSIKNNILFGNQYNRKIFQRVIQATALDADIAQMTGGIDTLVGDQGVMLSGGQKARVNMARALYRDADIYLLDDPLSAVDAKVSKHLFEKSIKVYLRKKIRILVTHQIQFLQDATKIIVLDKGEMLKMGTYNELLQSFPLFAKLLEDINQHEQELQHSTSFTNQHSAVESIHSENDGFDDDNAQSLLENVEKKQEGIVTLNVYLTYLRSGISVIIGSLLLLIIFGVHQTTLLYSHWWLAAWGNDGNYKNSSDCSAVTSNKTNSINDIEWKINQNRRFYVLMALVLLLLVLTFLRTVVCRLICLNAGRVLHNKMFLRVIRCPISFFDTNPIGRILNRFTSDIATLDESLPLTVFEVFVCLSHVLGSIVLVGLLNPWSFIPALIAGLSMFYIRHCFASCSRDLKRLFGVTRSPIYSQLTSTIQGLKVIRSYGAENICSKEFHNHLDNNTRVHFLIIILNRWSAMRFDWISLMFVCLVIMLAITIRLYQKQFSTVDIALTLSYSLTLIGTFQWTIRQTVELENQMTSVERVLEYCLLDQESSTSRQSSKCRLPPPIDWPSKGRIVFENVSMSHSNNLNSPLALRNISLSIEHSEKIGIVGRTGAGKSSFLQTLFRMGTIVNGRILIDGVDIEKIELDYVRQQISIIPQDPVLFIGTIRSNLDPFSVYSDADLWSALEQVQLKTFVAQTMPNGLHSLVNENGSNLSVGQKQLVCLARAILKKSKILVIDEATANVDSITDDLIQKAIRANFSECTVLTIAHRLRTVIDSDRIMVLSNGNLVEFDSPRDLLSNSSSHFSLLVEQTGAAEAEHLRSLANIKESSKHRQENIEGSDNETELDISETDPLVRS